MLKLLFLSVGLLCLIVICSVQNTISAIVREGDNERLKARLNVSEVWRRNATLIGVILGFVIYVVSMGMFGSTTASTTYYFQPARMTVLEPIGDPLFRFEMDVASDEVSALRQARKVDQLAILLVNMLSMIDAMNSAGADLPKNITTPPPPYANFEIDKMLNPAFEVSGVPVPVLEATSSVATTMLVYQTRKQTVSSFLITSPKSGHVWRAMTDANVVTSSILGLIAASASGSTSSDIGRKENAEVVYRTDQLHSVSESTLRAWASLRKERAIFRDWIASYSSCFPILASKMELEDLRMMFANHFVREIGTEDAMPSPEESETILMGCMKELGLVEGAEFERMKVMREQVTAAMQLDVATHSIPDADELMASAGEILATFVKEFTSWQSSESFEAVPPRLRKRMSFLLARAKEVVSAE